MENPKLLSKTFTLTRRETGPLKQPSYRGCSKWFEKSIKVKDRILGGKDLCPFCKQRVFPVSGIRPALVALWWWFKELFIRKKE